MSQQRILINEFLETRKRALVLDVRSPAEFAHAHIPGAINLPLFSDEERKIVGTTYKQQSREQAIKIGLDFFGPKMRKMVEEVEQLIAAQQQEGQQNNQDTTSEKKEFSSLHTTDSKPTIALYCWRGGMRSAAVAWLLNLYGFPVTVLAGGYKSFRNYVLKSFEFSYPFKIIGGYTGSGKTEVLHKLQDKNDIIIDLEKIACHKGSAFGNINMPPQPSQEMFENILSLELKQSLELLPQKNEKAIWLEDESQRIGNLNLPIAFWDTMRASPVYFLEIPFEERLQHVVEEYGSAPKEKLSGAIERITKRLGGLEAKNALQHLDDNNILECFRILLTYYDKHYLKGLQNRSDLPTLLQKISCENVSAENALLLHQAEPVI